MHRLQPVEDQVEDRSRVLNPRLDAVDRYVEAILPPGNYRGLKCVVVAVLDKRRFLLTHNDTLITATSSDNWPTSVRPFV